MLAARFPLLCCAATALLVLTACGGADDSDDDPGPSGDESSSTTGAAGDPATVWLVSAEGTQLVPIDAESHDVGTAIRTGEFPISPVVAGGSTWVFPASQLVGYDESGEPTTYEVDGGAAAVAAGADGSLWVTNQNSPHEIMSFDPDSGEFGDPIPMPDEDTTPEDVVDVDGVLYASDSWAGGLVRIDTDSGDVIVVEDQDLPVDGVVTDVAVIGDVAYFATDDAVLARSLDDLSEVETYSAPSRAWRLAVTADGNLAVADDAGSVALLDIASGEFGSQQEIDADALLYPDIATVGDQLWIAGQSGTVMVLDATTLEVQDTIEDAAKAGTPALAVGYE